MEENRNSLLWIGEGEKKVYSSPLFDVTEERRRSKSGKEGTFISLKTKDWVVAIPWFLDENKTPCFLMEEQFRHGSKSVTREFPAGLLESGESPLEGAKRELLEETGMSGNFIFLSEVNPNSAFMTNRQTFYLVDSLEKKAEQNLDPNEEIKIVKVPVEEVIENMGSGIYDNGIMMMALGFFLRLSEKMPELRGKK